LDEVKGGNGVEWCHQNGVTNFYSMPCGNLKTVRFLTQGSG